MYLKMDYIHIFLLTFPDINNPSSQEEGCIRDRPTDFGWPAVCSDFSELYFLGILDI
jgi:hypothetical protein